MKQRKETTVKLSANIKLDVDGQIINFDDLLKIINQQGKSEKKQGRAIVPSVIRKYECAIDSRNKLQNLLDGVRKLYSKNKMAPITAANKNVHGLLGAYFSNFIQDNEKRLLDAIKMADMEVESTRKEYEKSIYHVRVA